MRLPSTSKIVLLSALFSYALAQRRGGGRGGSSGGSGGGDDDDDDDDFDYDDGSDDGGSDTGGGSSVPCGWRARQYAFGLPGLYYNGTLTIRHLLDDNTAWEDAEQVVNYCDNDDRKAKTYEYPAMLLIAPTANESDTNPFHWVLRGHQPAYDYNGLGNVDFWQRWVYIRSSDFVLSNRTTLFSTDYDVDRLEDMDATEMNRETRVYWKTEVTSNEDKNENTFSARAEYVEPPPMIDLEDDAYRNMPSWLPGKRTSGYVTLSDICAYDQYKVDDYDHEEEIEDIRVASTGGNSRRRQHQRREEQSLTGSSPTLWLEKGVEVEMEDIGAQEMTWSFNTTMTKTIPWIGTREGGCRTNGVENEGFEWGDFYPLQSYNNREDGPGYIVPWNITVKFSLSFSGSLVSENSTSIQGEKDGKLIFERDYTEFTEEAANEQEDAGTQLSAFWAGTAGFLLTSLVLVT